MATAAAPACLRCVPSFSPTLQAPPLSRSVTKSSFSPRPFAPGRRLPLDTKKHVGPWATLEPRRMRGKLCEDAVAWKYWRTPKQLDHGPKRLGIAYTMSFSASGRSPTVLSPPDTPDLQEAGE
nr:uncharacterized protein LOC123282972 [Equus asinus]